MSVTLSTEQLQQIITSAVTAAISSLQNQQVQVPKTLKEHITETKASIVNKQWEPRAEDGEFLKILTKYVSKLENDNYVFAHYFVDLNVKREFIQYILNGGDVVTPFVCDHKTFSSGHLHAHVIVGTKNENNLKNRMAHFSRWLKTQHNKVITKKTNRVPINNYVHLINTALYIQTIQGTQKKGRYDHENHTFKKLIFENEAEKLLFKRGPVIEKWPDFIDDERTYAQEAMKRPTAYNKRGIDEPGPSGKKFRSVHKMLYSDTCTTDSE